MDTRSAPRSVDLTPIRCLIAVSTSPVPYQPAFGGRKPCGSKARVALAMPVVWSDRHRLHDPGGEVWVGVRTPGTEVAERAERVREALEADGARLVEAEPQPDAAFLAVHDPALLAYLDGAWRDWGGGGSDGRPRPGPCGP